MKRGVSPSGRDGYAQDEDPKSANSGAIGATENEVLRRPVRSGGHMSPGGEDSALQQPPQLDIVAARGHEMPGVLALVEELLVELGGEGQESAGIDRQRLQADLAGNIASGRFLALLAKDQSGTPIGVLTLSTSFALYAGGEYGIIDEMYVSPEWRGQGIGKALVAEAVAIARDKRWSRLDVTGPVEDGEGRTAGFYRKAGFEFTGPKLRLLV
jgi:GNAT superfamily N-acetyltransferase